MLLQNAMFTLLRAFVRYWTIPVCVLALVAGTFPDVNAQQPNSPPVVLTDGQDSYSLEPVMQILNDPTHALTFDDIRSPEYANQFVAADAQADSFGLNGGTVWARFRVRNDSARNDWLLKIQDQRLAYIDLYRPNSDGSYRVKSTGSYLPFNTREIDNHSMSFRLGSDPQSEQTLYLRMNSPLPVALALEILSPEKLEAAVRSELLTWGLFYGAMLIIAGYNLILFFSLHDIAYLFLSIVILGFAASKAANDGLGHAYVWPQFSNRWTIEYAMLVTMLAAGLFTTTFLELKHRAPKIHRTFYLLTAALLLTLLLVPFVNTLPIVLVLLGVELALILSTSGYAWRKGYRPARLFLLAWFFPLVATFTFILYHFGRLPFGFFASELVLVFLAMLALLWSLALADRIRLIQTQAQTAEKNLASTENRYRSLFQDSNDAVFIAARTGEILDLNPAGLNLFGYTRAELETLHTPDLFRTPDEYSQWQRLLEQDGFVAEYEALMRARDGTALTIVISSTRWRDEQTGLAGYQGILRDVTERRRTQQELDTYRLHLEEMVAARTAQARAELAERERAELALERRIQELSALNEIAKTMSTVTDLAPALQTVTAAIRNLFQMDAAAIYAFHPADRTLSCLASDPPNTLTAELTGPVRVRATIPLLDNSAETTTPRALRADENPHLFQAACAFLPPLPYATLAFVPLRAGGILNGILLFGATRSDALPENSSWDLVETIGGTIATAIENARMYEQAQTTAVAGERQRLARELHDSVTQLLYSIVLLAGGWSMEAAQGDLRHAQIGTYFDELAELGQQALGEMRLLLYQLRSSVLSQVGLSGALKQRLNAVEERVGIQTKLHTVGEVDSLPLHLQAEVYFIAQEALNNALRHAHASLVQIELTRRNERLELVVQDNGNGFDPNIVTEGMGLQNMSTRAQLLGAEFQVISNYSEGTRIQLCMDMMPEVEG